MNKETFVAFATQKGGVGKSTVTALVANYIHNVMGIDVAVIDCDEPQHSIAGLRDKETALIEKNDSLKAVACEHFRKSGRKGFPIVRSNAVQALDDADSLLSEKGYQPEIDGYDITNSYTPGKVSVTVSKSWEDENDQDGIRPDTVKIRLFADGKDTGKTLVLSEENRWSGIFADLDEYKNGEKINYSIKEDAVNGYHTVISGDAEKGFVVTNSHTPVKTESTPETGDRGTPALWIVLMGLAGTAIVTGSYLAEKKRKTYRK